MKSSPHHQGFCDITQKKHQKQNHQQMGRDEKYTQDHTGCFQASRQCGIATAGSRELQTGADQQLHSLEVNEMSADETSGDEFKVNEMSRGKRWGNNNNYKHSNYSNNCNFNSRPQYNKPQDSKHGRPWGQR